MGRALVQLIFQPVRSGAVEAVLRMPLVALDVQNARIRVSNSSIMIRFRVETIHLSVAMMTARFGVVRE